jgi:hypothetical protein
LIGIGGERFGQLQIAAKVQLGLTFSGKSYWVSDTRVYFYTPPGIGIVQTIVLSIVRLRVIAEGADGNPLFFYYDQPNIYRLISANTPTDAAHSRITVAGLNYGTIDYSSQTKLGDSPYMYSYWTSDTSVSTRVPSGLGRALTAWELVANQVGYTDDILSYDEPVLSSIIPGNQIIQSMFSVLSTITGLDFAVYDTTLSFMMGSTAVESTQWVADSTLSCRIPSGFRASREISVTVSMLSGTVSDSFSYNEPNLVSLQSRSNSAKQCEIKLTGRLISTYSDLSVSLRLGSSSCESSAWISDSAVICLSQPGDQRTISLYLSLAGRVGSLSQQFTFDSNVLSQSGKTNSPALSVHTMMAQKFLVAKWQNFTVNSSGFLPNITFWSTGAQFGSYDSSNMMRSGLTSSEATAWISESTVYAAYPDGHFSSRILIITSATLQPGTLTSVLTFDMPVLSSLFSTNSPRSGQVFSLFSGSEMGSSHYSAAARVGGCILGFCLNGLLPSTPCTNTVWSSNSAVACKFPLGIPDGASLSLTTGVRVGSVSSVFTYDEWPLINSMNNSNAPTRYGRVFMQGINLGSQHLSPHARIGFTASEMSFWVASSAVLCMVASGMDVNMPTTLTLGFNQTIRVQATACGIFSYNVPTLSSIKGSNSPELHGVPFTVRGSDFSWGDSSPSMKFFRTESVSTLWRSDTSLFSLKAAGMGISVSTSVTASYQRIGSATEIFSHDGEILLVGTQLNAPSTLSSMKLMGANFGRTSLSLMIRLGTTSAQMTTWTSDTQCQSLQSGVGSGSLRLAVTSGLVVGTSSNLASFDLAMLLRSNDTGSIICSRQHSNNTFAALEACVSEYGNTPVLGNMILVGGTFGSNDNTPTFRIGVSSSQTSIWVSASLVLCKPSIGIGLNLKGSVTVFSRAGSQTNSFTYDPASASSVQFVNSPIRLQKIFNVTGTVTDLDPYMQPRSSLSDGPSLLMTFVRGQNYGVSDMSVLSFAIGSTACEVTVWISTSGVYCRRAVGISSTKLSVCTIAQGLGTLTQLYSFDTPLIDTRSLSSANSPAIASTFISFGSLVECDRGFFFNDSFIGMLCMPCNPGSFCPGTNKAIQCQLGNFSAGFGMTVCNLCGNGTYQDTLGATSCKQCPLQGQNSSRGSISVLNCTCPNSTFPMSSFFLSRGICPRNMSNATSNLSTANISINDIATGQFVNTPRSVAPITVTPVSGGLGLYDYSPAR